MEEDVGGHAVAVEVLKVYKKSDKEKVLRVCRRYMSRCYPLHGLIIFKIQEFSSEAVIWR